MNNVEKRLAEEKKRMESITAPDELEMRLRNALNTATPKRIKRIAPIWKIAAVAIFFMVIVGISITIRLPFMASKLLRL